MSFAAGDTSARRKSGQGSADARLAADQRSGNRLVPFYRSRAASVAELDISGRRGAAVATAENRSHPAAGANRRALFLVNDVNVASVQRRRRFESVKHDAERAAILPGADDNAFPACQVWAPYRSERAHSDPDTSRQRRRRYPPFRPHRVAPLATRHRRHALQDAATDRRSRD